MRDLFFYVIGPILSFVLMAAIGAAMCAGSRADDENEVMHNLPKKDRDE